MPQVCGKAAIAPLSESLFEFQKALVRWALRMGRAALFADTGLGKTLMQLEWARLLDEPTLILAPLAVAKQTVQEGDWWKIPVGYARHQSEVRGRITVTNYDMLEEFDPAAFRAVVLDESSILKNFEGKTRAALIAKFSATPYRLCCTATPAPNDISEIANHAEFLGIMTRQEMLAKFFVHDDEGWRLKGHASEPFYAWMASWAMHLKSPADLGFGDEGYVLPPLEILAHFIEVPPQNAAGTLFPVGLKGIGDRARVRKNTVDCRVKRAAEIVNSEREPFIVWCGLNDESRTVAELIPDAVHIEGRQSPEVKEELLGKFLAGAARVLVTKPSIAGFGLNMQHCARMVFLGLSDSYESYYQAIRRCWRFGQKSPVRADIVLTDMEAQIYENILRKERESESMKANLIRNVAALEREELSGHEVKFNYQEKAERGEGWELLLGDAVERVAEIPEESIDLAVFSPPFQSLYTYSPSERDIGNCKTVAEYWEHFGYLIDGILGAMKPGRNVCVHVAQLTSTKATHGVIGLQDFRGETIRRFIHHGFIYHGEICIDKDPQAQAIRTHSKALLFVQKDKDSSWLRPALADFILIFRKPGENAAPIKCDLTNDEWIEWARPIWYGIDETDTLNAAQARAEKDERHICPLQLGTIERCVRLWSNRGETVLSPFAGIGSEGYQALKLDRRFIGIELKPEYFAVAIKNLKAANANGSLFSRA